MIIALEIIMAAAVGGLLAAVSTQAYGLEIAMKTTASLCFVLAGVLGHIKNKTNRRFSLWIVFALVCSMAGDVLLAVDTNKGLCFVVGVASFAAAHIMFAIAFCKASRIHKADIIAAVIVFGGLLALLLLGNFEYGGLFPVIAGYAAVISFMTVKAVSLWRHREGREVPVLMISVGAVLFLASDVVLLFWLFGIDTPRIVRTINLILYYTAQGLLSYSLNLFDRCMIDE